MTTDVTKRRIESAVGNLGVIETGLPTNRHSTVTSEFREGRCILEKCEVISRTVSFCGATNKVDVKVKNKVLLHPLRVDLPAGSITAVLGGAGSGTSTLLKFLAGQMDKNVTYDGKGEFKTRVLLPSASLLIYITFAILNITHVFFFALHEYS
jgi:ATPase subunit of ABC transporter with duplicated ATPase domains